MSHNVGIVCIHAIAALGRICSLFFALCSLACRVVCVSLSNLQRKLAGMESECALSILVVFISCRIFLWQGGTCELPIKIHLVVAQTKITNSSIIIYRTKSL